MSAIKYLIIGNSAAGIHAAETIRKYDGAGAITILTDEPYHTYSRPLISYLLLGKTTEDGMKYRGAAFYDENRITLCTNTRVTTISPDAKTVTTAAGKTLSYNKLLVATGSSPFVPPMAGLDTVTHKTTFGSLEDAKRLEAMLTPQSRVLIVGAGLIGLKCAEGILGRVGKITVVDLAPRILSSILDDDTAATVQRHLETKGIRFYLGESVAQFTPDTAALTGGETLPFDVVVTAVGVRANVSLLRDLGAAVGRGITVNERCETSLADIYAAGDCTECRNCATGDIQVMALLPNAAQQGICAGAQMAGQDEVFDTAIPMNSIGLSGLHLMTAGSYTGDCVSEVTDAGTKKFFVSDNRLNGFILVDAIDRAGIYTRLVREGTPLDSVDFSLLCKAPALSAFSAPVRKDFLGKEH